MDSLLVFLVLAVLFLIFFSGWVSKKYDQSRIEMRKVRQERDEAKRKLGIYELEYKEDD